MAADIRRRSTPIVRRPTVSGEEYFQKTTAFGRNLIPKCDIGVVDSPAWVYSLGLQSAWGPLLKMRAKSILNKVRTAH